MNKPRPFQVYRHFRGKTYQILNLAWDAEDGRELVVYQGLYPPYQIWVRPLDQFVEVLDRKKYPEAEQVHRFELLLVEGTAEPEQPDKAAPVESAEETALPEAFNAFLDARDNPARIAALESLMADPKGVTPFMTEVMADAIGAQLSKETVPERLAEIRESLRILSKYEVLRP